MTSRTNDDATLRNDDDRTVIRSQVLPTDPSPANYATAAPSPPLKAQPAELGDFLRGGMNPLAQAASPLLVLAVQLRHSASVPDIPRLREQAVLQIRQFENHAQSIGIPAQTVLAARYVLCTMIDESVLNTPWGDPTGWSQRTLLVTFHGETYGGAKFFQILDRLSQDFSRHLDLIELMYACLALGFGGRYLVEPGGVGRLADIQEDLYRRIRALREAPATELAPHWQGMDDRRNPFLRYIPLWLVALCALCVLLVAFLYAFNRLGALEEPLSARLAPIGIENAPPPAAKARVAPVRKTLKQLLAPEEQAGKLSVDEQPDGRASVRLAASEMFPSGAADITADEVPLLHRITWALNQIPGRVVVVGHTDDQPVRSLRYKDNFELSSQRARNTVQILADGIDDSRRLESSGAGPSQPVATPVDVPANRARNRRVEITYLPEMGP